MKQSTSLLSIIVFCLLFLISSCQKEGMLPIDPDYPVSAILASQSNQSLAFEVASDKLMADFNNDRAVLIPSYQDCDKALQNIVDLLQPLANKHCKSYYFCILCMEYEWPAYFFGIVNPKGCSLQQAKQYFPVNDEVLHLIGLNSNTILDNDNTGKVTTYTPSATFRVAIQANACTLRGESLIVYNPANWDTFSDPDKYAIRWYQNGLPYSTGNEITCICGGEYFAIVYNIALQELVGIAFYQSPCNADDQEASVFLK
jgi:hypothetical protein